MLGVSRQQLLISPARLGGITRLFGELAIRPEHPGRSRRGLASLLEGRRRRLARLSRGEERPQGSGFLRERVRSMASH